MRHVFDPRVAVLWNFLERSNAVESWFRKDLAKGIEVRWQPGLIQATANG